MYNLQIMLEQFTNPTKKTKKTRLVGTELSTNENHSNINIASVSEHISCVIHRSNSYNLRTSENS